MIIFFYSRNPRYKTINYIIVATPLFCLRERHNPPFRTYVKILRGDRKYMNRHLIPHSVMIKAGADSKQSPRSALYYYMMCAKHKPQSTAEK